MKKEIIMQYDQNQDVSEKNVHLQQKIVQMQPYSFTSKETTKSDSRYKSKFDFVSIYVEKKKQSLNET